ncbi:MAG: NAD(P)H-hydrate dehydratase [Bacteroidota bacterium]
MVTSDQIRECDRYAIEKLHIPGIILMENAGIGVVNSICRHYSSVEGKKFTIICGKGNNGGDGFVVARHLYNRGASIHVDILAKMKDIKGDAKINLDILREMFSREDVEGRLEIQEITSDKTPIKIYNSDFIIDAIFGTGFQGEIKGVYANAINAINKSQAIKIAIDIPSGLNANTGLIIGMAVKADLTVTIGMNKHGLTLSKSREYAGTLDVIDMGVSSNIISLKNTDTFLIQSSDVKKLLPKRSITAHKYSFKKVYILAGSTGFTGAAAMAANSALRTGAGMVILGTPRSVYPILSRKLTEIIVDPLDNTSDGTISLSALTAIKEKIDWADIVIVGPGLSKNKETQVVVREVLKTPSKSFLIDADGLAAIPLNSAVWRSKSRKKFILTPHIGELSRLIGVPSVEIENRRIEVARETAKKLKVTLILKGAPTVTASNDGKVYINSTGNPGMATAGSGDVLSGIIGGLLSQGLDEPEGAYAGVYLHGLAGDLAIDHYGEKSLMATDIYEYLPSAIKHIEMGA